MRKSKQEPKTVSDQPIPFELGCVVRDQVSGYRGTAIGLTLWLNGCVRAVVESETVQQGKAPESHSFDMQQLVVKAPAPEWVKKTPIHTAVRELMGRSPVINQSPGGPMPEPVRPGM